MTPAAVALCIGLLLLFIGIDRSKYEPIKKPLTSITVKKTSTIRAEKWFERKGISSKYNRTTLTLLFIFGGAIGLHHFYTDNITKGIIYAFTGEGFFIGKLKSY